MFTSISGRSVLVTGGTKGIGQGLAGAFAREGASVVITGRDRDAGERAAADLAAAGGTVSFVPGDVGRPEDCAAAVAAAQERHGGLDIVCCNAQGGVMGVPGRARPGDPRTINRGRYRGICALWPVV